MDSTSGKSKEGAVARIPVVASWGGVGGTVLGDSALGSRATVSVASKPDFLTLSDFVTYLISLNKFIFLLKIARICKKTQRQYIRGKLG